VPADPNLLTGLQEMALPFDSAIPESGFDDLAAFPAIVGDARIVALGEATHGTSEFFMMKHRLTELLVTELGFTIFAIEAPWPATKIINQYVHGGDANRQQLLDGLSFWVWQTQEVLDLIEWMREYNARPGVAMVSFQAFDMQVTLDSVAVQQVLAYVEEVDPAGVDRFRSYYAAIRHTPPADPTDADVEGAQAALDDLLTHREAYGAVASSEPYADIVQTARMIVQAETVWAAGQTQESFELRDQFMADTVAWLLDEAGADAKIILWAHNAHVASAALQALDGTVMLGMGSRLRERYGEAMLVVGFDFFSGAFNAIGQDINAAPSPEVNWVHRAPLPSPDSTEYTFAQLELSHFMLDLRSVDSGTASGDWLMAEHPMWMIGAVFNAAVLDEARAIVRLPESFDVLIYFHETSITRRLR
jgi:erythromycin esterase